MRGEKMKNKTDSSLREKIHDGVDRMMDRTESITKSSNKKMDYLKEKAIKMKRNADEYIKKNPKKTIMFAAGAGVVTGAAAATIWMRKKR